MTMKPGSTPITTVNTTRATMCGHCGIEERKLLHHVRLRGHFRRLCTTCVLRLHPQCFCPACLGVYDRSPPEDAVVCYKCYSSSHPTCVSSSAGPTPSRAPSPCSSCLNPNALVFNPKKVKARGGVGGGEDGSSCRAIDKNPAKLLLAAAKIASSSMNKAAAAAAAEAERRAKEAAFTKKRAREALDHVVYLMEKEKKNANSNKVVGNANSSRHVAIPLVVPVDTPIPDNKLDTSNQVLEALNAVGLKENGSQQQGFMFGSVSSEAESNGVVVMEVEVKNDEDLRVSSLTENGNGEADDLGMIALGEKASNGLVPLVGQEQSLEKNHVMEDNTGLQP